MAREAREYGYFVQHGHVVHGHVGKTAGTPITQEQALAMSVAKRAAEPKPALTEIEDRLAALERSYRALATGQP